MTHIALNKLMNGYTLYICSLSEWILRLRSQTRRCILERIVEEFSKPFLCVISAYSAFTFIKKQTKVCLKYCHSFENHRLSFASSCFPFAMVPVSQPPKREHSHNIANTFWGDAWRLVHVTIRFSLHYFLDPRTDRT